MRVRQTKAGVHFGMFQDKPAAPAPTLLIIANSIDSMGADPLQYYTATGKELAKQGWLYVVLDPACEGYQRKDGEPGGFVGWAHHLKRGHDFMTPYVNDCRDVLDELIANEYTDPKKIAVSGTSRGGFCALHFAAADERIQVVTAISPVTNPRALTECQDVTAAEAAPINIDSDADRLAGRTVWLTIGNDDQRVSTADTIRLAQTLTAATRRTFPDRLRIPVELIVGPSIGHRAIDQVYELEAKFLLRQFPSAR